MEKGLKRGLVFRILVVVTIVVGALFVSNTDSCAGTYRVYLARPTTSPPIWDWAQTVIAQNQNTAIDIAYKDWRNSQPGNPIPPLSQCRHQIRPIGTLPLLD